MGVDSIDGASWNQRHVARKFANNYDDPGHGPRPTANRSLFQSITVFSVMTLHTPERAPSAQLPSTLTDWSGLMRPLLAGTNSQQPTA